MDNTPIELPEPPKKSSELIRMAIYDLLWVSKNPQYKIDMKEWHTPSDGVCKVCLAGAVMARTLRVLPTEMSHASEQPYPWREELLFLDCVRTNHFVGANRYTYEGPSYVHNEKDLAEMVYKLGELADKLEADGE